MFIPAEFKQRETGIFEKEFKHFDLGEFYKDKARKSLLENLNHYKKLSKSFKTSPIFRNTFDVVKDIGGGNPKLASHINCKRVIVIDPIADVYAALHGEFERLYKIKAKVDYTFVDPGTSADLTIFCHVLEHLTIDEIKDYIKNADGDICIYGPNIERAEGSDWLHFGAEDHITFITLDKMEQIIESFGFMIKMSYEYDEDYLIYAQKE